MSFNTNHNILEQVFISKIESEYFGKICLANDYYNKFEQYSMIIIFRHEASYIHCLSDIHLTNNIPAQTIKVMGINTKPVLKKIVC